MTVTTNGVKKYVYRKLNVAHYAGYGISKNGKPVLNPQTIYKLLSAENLKRIQSWKYVKRAHLSWFPRASK